MAARMEQILRFGHTPEADRRRALWSAREFDSHGERSLMRAIAAQFSSAIEYASRGSGHHDVARRNLVKTAALCLAAIDWIDAELDALAQPPPAPGADHDFP